MQIHDLQQGSPEWDLFRLHHYGASEAAVMLGLSKKTTRSELLAMKYTGDAKEFSRWVQENILDYGHQVEALARPVVESLIGEDLYPVTCSGDLMPVWASCEMSASCDGLTMGEDTAFEHKQWNEQLAAQVCEGIVPDDHMPQCQQILMVTGAQRLYFVVSDGTKEKMVHTIVTPDQGWFERIQAGWEQFDKDLAEYQHTKSAPVAVGRTPENLPALHIAVSGEVTASNLAEYKEHALAVFAGINRTLTTDQHFADAATTVTWCKGIEDRLAAAKQHALSQTESIDQLFNTIDDVIAEARRTRLELNNLVEQRKADIRAEILEAGKMKLAEHVKALNERLGKPYMPTVSADFAGAMKGKRTVATLQDAVDLTLANAKIVADQAARTIETNLSSLAELAAEHMLLFADVAQLVQKEPDGFAAMVRVRISDHTVEQDRLAAEPAQPIEAPTPAPVPKAATLTQEKAWPFPSTSRAAASAEVPTLRLGQINERLAPISLTADGLFSLGFAHAATDKSAKLYHEHDFPLICAALAKHATEVQQAYAAQAA